MRRGSGYEGHLDDALPLDVGAVALPLQSQRGHQPLDLWAPAVRLAILTLLRLHQTVEKESQHGFWRGNVRHLLLMARIVGVDASGP